MKLTELAEEARFNYANFPPTKHGDKCGTFIFEGLEGQQLRVIASEGDGWDHVSVSRADRVPTWDEMCFIKRQFFSHDECVIQYHPPESEYVNTHPNVLHLWRPQNEKIPMPPRYCV